MIIGASCLWQVPKYHFDIDDFFKSYHNTCTADIYISKTSIWLIFVVMLATSLVFMLILYEDYVWHFSLEWTCFKGVFYQDINRIFFLYSNFKRILFTIWMSEMIFIRDQSFRRNTFFFQIYFFLSLTKCWIFFFLNVIIYWNIFNLCPVITSGLTIH